MKRQSQSKNNVVDVTGDGTKVWCCKMSIRLSHIIIISFNYSRSLMCFSLSFFLIHLFFIIILCVLSCFSHAQLCESMNCSPPGSSVHGIFQERVLEWVAMPFSRGSPWPRIKSRSPASQADSLWSEPPGKPLLIILSSYYTHFIVEELQGHLS